MRWLFHGEHQWGTKLCIAYWHIIWSRYRCDCRIVERRHSKSPRRPPPLRVSHQVQLPQVGLGRREVKKDERNEERCFVFVFLHCFSSFFPFFFVSPFSKVNILRHILALADLMQRLGTRWSRSNCRSSSLADSPSATTQDDQPFFFVCCFLKVFQALFVICGSIT